MTGTEEAKACPNCAYVLEKDYNFCPHCGQKTHLHNENFWGLVMHFVGDYFHYDSKFLQTLKALWFSPGKLTLAYWNKQRMRYIPPVSLYIFISAVFFLTSSILSNHYIAIDKEAEAKDTASHEGVHLKLTRNNQKPLQFNFSGSGSFGPNSKINGKTIDEIAEQIVHMAPKVFFFMIPFMALILKLLFARRKNLFYVQHIIYALHYHSFWFSIMLLKVLYPFDVGSKLLTLLAVGASVMYFIVSMRNVYGISWRRSIFYSLLTGWLYLIFILVCFAIVFAAVLF